MQSEAIQSASLPPVGCKTSSPFLWFLLVFLASSNNTDLDELSDAVQIPNKVKLLFVSSPSSPKPSLITANMSSRKHGAFWGTRWETVEADDVFVSELSPVSVESIVWLDFSVFPDWIGNKQIILHTEKQINGKVWKVWNELSVTVNNLAVTQNSHNIKCKGTIQKYMNINVKAHI